MKNALFNCMESKGLVSRNRPRERAISHIPPKKVIEIAEDLSQLTRATNEKTPRGGLAHCASISLGGGRDECWGFECRSLRLERLARFAAFYSDRVYVHNPFSDYASQSRYSQEELQKSLFDDVRLCLMIRPLANAGLVRLVTEPGILCEHCLAEALGMERSSGNRIVRAMNQLAEEFLRNTSFAFGMPGDVPGIVVSGPQPYHLHPRVLQLPEVPTPIRKNPTLLRAMRAHRVTTLPKKVARELRIHRHLAADVLRNLSYYFYVNRVLPSSFLTERELHLAFLRQASSDPATEERNMIAYRHLTTMVPLAGDVPIGALTRLRAREEESFVQFRAELNRAIDTFRELGTGFTEKTARAVYADIIAPKLANLDKRVRTAKRDLVTSVTRPLLGMVGAISFGLLSGTIPAEFAQLVQVAGAVSFGARLLETTMSLGDKQRAIEHEPLYFLWRVKKLAKRG